MDDYLNQSKRASFSINDIIPYVVILLIAKFLKASGIYLCYDLLKHIHVIQLLFFASAIACAFFLILQRPFSSSSSSSVTAKPNQNVSSTNKRLNKIQYIRIFKYSLVQTFIRIIWLFGLTQCGPLRTTLLFEQSECEYTIFFCCC